MPWVLSQTMAPGLRTWSAETGDGLPRLACVTQLNAAVERSYACASVPCDKSCILHIVPARFYDIGGCKQSSKCA